VFVVALAPSPPYLADYQRSHFVSGTLTSRNRHSPHAAAKKI